MFLNSISFVCEFGLNVPISAIKKKEKLQIWNQKAKMTKNGSFKKATNVGFVPD